MPQLTDSVKCLSGIGDKKAALLEKIGILTLEDLIRFFPRGYQNRRDVKTLLDAQLSGEVCTMVVTVSSKPQNALLKNRKTITKFTVCDETGKCNVVFFNRQYIKNEISYGDTLRLFGKVISRRSGGEILSPDFELMRPERPLADIYPIYPLTKGLNQKAMRSMILSALTALSGNMPSLIPDAIIKKHSLMSAEDAFTSLHMPKALTSVTKAREYFVFEELFSLALAVELSKNTSRKAGALPLKIPKEEFSKFTACFPFEFTFAQKKVINEIASDMAKPFAMHRLVTGDVGCGKTVCAAAAAYIALASGKQALLMAPTEILARQHYEDLSPIFESLGYKTALLISGIKQSEKNRIHKEIESGEIRFVIGTHAVISKGVIFENAALAICDEQHRFGVNQRAALGEKTGGMHMLVMSATPIPRTLALALHGDLDISSVNEMPPGRQKVKTYRVDESYRERLNAFIEKQASSGYGVYIVCPSIEKADDDDEELASLIDPYGKPLSKLKDALSYTEELRRALPTVAIGYVHGRMKSSDRDAVMSAFQRGELSVLVSTTVIEVGVNVPRATLMIVENAERFGLSQLHQLRGRVGRGKYQSFCILVSDAKSDAANSRLSALCDCTDGYEIAERDLALRGPGDFLAISGTGTRQSGDAGFRLASVATDMDLLRKAFDSAEEYLKCAAKDDPFVKRAAALLLKGVDTLS